MIRSKHLFEMRSFALTPGEHLHAGWQQIEHLLLTRPQVMHRHKTFGCICLLQIVADSLGKSCLLPKAGRLGAQHATLHANQSGMEAALSSKAMAWQCQRTIESSFGSHYDAVTQITVVLPTPPDCERVAAGMFRCKWYRQSAPASARREQNPKILVGKWA